MPYPGDVSPVPTDLNQDEAKMRIDQLRGPAIMQQVLSWPVLSPPGLSPDVVKNYHRNQMDLLRQKLQLPEPQYPPVQVIGTNG